MTIQRYRLSNGLRLVHRYEPGTRMAALNLMYNVGSKDEHPDHTGFAHLFEHLMFSGSKHVPNYEKAIQEACGDNNAWTSVDATSFYTLLPAHHLETALFLESDRMMYLNLNRRAFGIQKKVVAEEFKQRFLNQPYGDLQKLMRQAVYGNHPYSWSTIGKELSHIENFRLDQVKAFYQRFYAPDNACLSVVGNVSFDTCREVVEKWFGDIPPAGPTGRCLPRLPEQTAPVKVEVRRKVPHDMLCKVWRAPACLEPGFAEGDLLTDLLDEGNSSRLFQRLVKEHTMFSSLDISLSTDSEPGAGTIQFIGKPTQGVSLEEADEALEKELTRLYTEGIGRDELQKAKNKHESGFLFRDTNCPHVAQELAWHETLGDARLYLQGFETTMALRPEDLEKTAREVFRPERCTTLYYRREEGAETPTDSSADTSFETGVGEE